MLAFKVAAALNILGMSYARDQPASCVRHASCSFALPNGDIHEHTTMFERTISALEAQNATVWRNTRPLLPWVCENDNPILREKHGCFFQNGAVPYAFLDVPRSDEGPWDDEPDFHHFRSVGEKESRQRDHQWRIAPEEALVLVGCTPPGMRYFGFAPILTGRHTSHNGGSEVDAKWEVIAGSVGDAMNSKNILLHEGDGPFSSPFSLVISASFEAEAAAIAALGKAGTDPGRVNTLRIPGRLREKDALFRSADMYLGTGQHDDMFEIITRFAFPER
jgi:hypothetical protein